ncbi:MAG: type restriction enzyme subunit [Pyrinomonadaceae bacterium]|nr:type restriction enzyme subunit [Pyrinomonadaceae bacterium]
MSMNESDTRAKLIDPALHARGWTEDLIKREETAGAIEIHGDRARRRGKGRADYTLRVKVGSNPQPVAVALIEAKAEGYAPAHGLEQAKVYADAKRLNVPFVFATNGHQFVEYDASTKLTSDKRAMSAFPTPAELRARYEQHVKFNLDDEAAKPLLKSYPAGEATRRYYQDAAIRAVLEKLARGEKRALLTLATGAGKTFIAVHLLKRIADAGQMRKALFICDRDELRTQATGALQNVFGANAAAVSSGNAQKNARILIATYQTLGVESDEADASFLLRHYPENYFSHIVIDECHRSAWGKWSQVLKRNPDAVQVGLTATPRQLLIPDGSAKDDKDAEISADNIRHFGLPVYEYDMAQGIEDGYLAACEIIRRDIFINAKAKTEGETGLEAKDLEGVRLVDATTGEPLSADEIRKRYAASSFESSIKIKARVQVMAQDLFSQLVATGTPEQKTIIFCVRDSHADDVAIALNNLYAEWCRENNRAPVDNYAFKCTAESGGGDYIADLKGGTRHHFIATTVDLLTTGVDVPNVRNIVFFRYVKSPIAFYQMVGRGTRLDPTTGKLMFRVYDYTDATRLFGAEFKTRLRPAPTERPDILVDPPPPPPVAEIEEGVSVQVTDAGRFIVASVDGKAMPIPAEEYRQRLAARLVEQAETLDEFRAKWIVPDERNKLMEYVRPYSPKALRAVEEMEDYDLYDVLADVGYGMSPHTRLERAESFGYKQAEWLGQMPPATAKTVQAIAAQFARGGTEGLESDQLLRTPEVKNAGGLNALKALERPAREVLNETKERIFSA